MCTDLQGTPEISQLAISSSELVKFPLVTPSHTSGDLNSRAVAMGSLVAGVGSDGPGGLSIGPIDADELKTCHSKPIDDGLERSRNKHEQNAQRGQPLVFKTGLSPNKSTFDGRCIWEGPKRRLDVGELMESPVSKRGKEATKSEGLRGEDLVENSLAELFHVGASGPLVHEKHKRLRKSGLLGRKALRQKQVSAIAELSETKLAEEAGLSMPHPFHEAHIVELSGVGSTFDS